MNELFLKIINMSISASWLILAVLILRLVLKKAPKWVNVLLWGIVAVRLICPLSFESALSLIPSSETIPLDIEMAAKPTIDSGVPAINSVVNPVLSSFAPPQHVLTSANPLQIWIPILNIIWLIGVGALLLYTAVRRSFPIPPTIPATGFTTPNTPIEPERIILVIGLSITRLSTFPISVKSYFCAITYSSFRP